jgi:hypothetical protein
MLNMNVVHGITLIIRWRIKFVSRYAFLETQPLFTVRVEKGLENNMPWCPQTDGVETYITQNFILKIWFKSFKLTKLLLEKSLILMGSNISWLKVLK